MFATNRSTWPGQDLMEESKLIISLTNHACADNSSINCHGLQRPGASEADGWRVSRLDGEGPRLKVANLRVNSRFLWPGFEVYAWLAVPISCFFSPSESIKRGLM